MLEKNKTTSRIASLLPGTRLVSGSACAAVTTIKPTRGTIDSVNDSAVQITARQGDKLGFKNAKHIGAIFVTNQNPGGYWESQGDNGFSGI